MDARRCPRVSSTTDWVLARGALTTLMPRAPSCHQVDVVNADTGSTDHLETVPEASMTSAGSLVALRMMMASNSASAPPRSSAFSMWFTTTS